MTHTLTLVPHGHIIWSWSDNVQYASTSAVTVCISIVCSLLTRIEVYWKQTTAGIPSLVSNL